MAAQDGNEERLMVVAAVVDQRSRDWTIEYDDFETEEAFRQAIEIELARFEHLGFRTGRALIAAPIRTRAEDDGTYITIGWRFQEAFMPAAKPAVAEAEPELEPEPVAG